MAHQRCWLVCTSTTLSRTARHRHQLTTNLKPATPHLPSFVAERPAQAVARRHKRRGREHQQRMAQDAGVHRCVANLELAPGLCDGTTCGRQGSQIWRSDFRFWGAPQPQPAWRWQRQQWQRQRWRRPHTRGKPPREAIIISRPASASTQCRATPLERPQACHSHTATAARQQHHRQQQRLQGETDQRPGCLGSTHDREQGGSTNLRDRSTRQLVTVSEEETSRWVNVNCLGSACSWEPRRPRQRPPGGHPLASSILSI